MPDLQPAVSVVQAPADMRMRFAYLGSGSRGNSAIIEHDGSCIMLDNGFSLKESEARLARLELDPAALDGIVVTHEHGDHISGVGPLARKYGLPVWMTAGTWRTGAARVGALPSLHLIDPHCTFGIDGIELRPYVVPHDACEPVQFVFGDGAHRLGILTDIGHITTHVVEMLDGCDALALECNHDRRMLEEGPYPDALKARVGGRLGHLENHEAADLLARIDSTRIQHLIAVHLSETNNTQYHAREALASVGSCALGEIEVACQQAGLGWRTLAGAEI